MQCPIQFWAVVGRYKTIEEIANSFEVVNDCVERGVKLLNKFKDVCMDIYEQNALFQVLEKYRDYARALS